MARRPPPAGSGHALDLADKQVHVFLKRCGVKRPEGANPCLKAGLLWGKLAVPPQFLGDGADAAPYLQPARAAHRGVRGVRQGASVHSQEGSLKQDTCGGDYEGKVLAVKALKKRCGSVVEPEYNPNQHNFTV